MLFNSFAFLGLCLITLFLYYLPLFSRAQVKLLIIASMLFYAYDQPALVVLLLLSAGINTGVSYWVLFGNATSKKALATLGVGLNLAILAFFKYSPLFARTFLPSGNDIGRFLLTIPLPIGISFFTFEGISLTIDLYKNKAFSQREGEGLTFTKHAERTLFFISFFPHLVAGPILKAHDFLPQISRKYFRNIEWEAAFKCLVVGYFLKMVVADNLKDFTLLLDFPYHQYYSSLTLLTMLFGYSIQIFADFAGYSAIALGLGKLFGYTLQENFNFPYISTSFKEFWKRWHISLSTFLLEYLYIPLGGNRKGRARTYLHLILTMFLGGLWHGAAWSYAIWGLCHGLALALEKLAGYDRPSQSTAIQLVRGLLVFIFVTLAWLLFKLPNFADVISFVRSVAKNSGALSTTRINSSILVYSLPVVIYHLYYVVRPRAAWRPVVRLEYIGYGLLLFLILVNSGNPGSFIYFQF
ncbi:membrane bound O-acyl transferase MBOAT family protein [Hymenobacter roseosalivarius DSM 11622]|uniref:Membrane bound O-acyl transferase MBOAT family protein n=1 Tax=Hymenobacter roseosalivarius DSM 11622 TaxID=645990 RepID=A0A1W1VU39_9BACT|nr:MBOAT family O-acyltransferase [Hymenobacter roseosalivarius]SMB96836.1 membrane bound O-acyl transferase MBOAT family protein [Hymenobacter roseosalivarius DSM 11622]